MKSSLDCNLRLDLSVSGCSIVVRHLDSWHVGEPQKKAIGRNTRFDRKVSATVLPSTFAGSSFGCQWRLSS